MKTSHLAATSAAVIAMCTLVSNRLNAQSTIPAIPVGVMSAFPTIVQTGTKPTLTWNILYPSMIYSPNNGNGNGNGNSGGNLVTVSPPGTLTLNQNNIYVSVQPIGTGVTACDPTQGTAPLYTEVKMSLNGGAYQQLFYGTQADVNSSYSLYIKKLKTNDVLNFGGRYVKNGSWTPFYTTKSSNFQVVALVNGDPIPTTFPLYQSSTLASYLKPYLDGSGKVKIGPLSVLILMELGQTDHSLTCFDYQDQAILVTFSTNHPNNGHGNNLDGIDSSNPGKGKGGPNGGADTMNGYDDEIR